MGSFLIMLVAVCMHTLFANGVRFVLESNERLDCQRNALFAMARLSREVTESSGDCVQTYFSPLGVTFASARDASGRFHTDAKGELVWQRMICYYQDTIKGEPCLLRKERDLTAAEQTANPVSPGVNYNTTSFAKDSTAPKVVARGIETFEVNNLGGQLGIRLVARVNNSAERDFSVEVNTTASMRN